MHSLRRELLAFIGLLIAHSFAAAATNEVSEPFTGVRLIHTTSTVPRLVDMWVVEIDMTAPGLAFFATPSNGALVGDTTPQTTRAFATQHGLQLAVNANFFASAGSGQYDVLGVSVSNGNAYSPFQSGHFDAVNVSQSNVATIIRGSGSGYAHTPATMLYNAVSGNTRLVTGGANVASSDPAIHPRTAAGVTADGKLLFFTVDGRNTPHSQGLTYAEMADVLIRWGARDAINLDGGGSTTLVMDDPSTAAANDPRVMNIPVGVGNVPSSERSNGNNIGLHASRQTQPTQSVFTFADFEQGDAGSFNSAITFSGSNRGFNTQLSSAATVSGQGHDGGWSQRLTIIDDPATTGDPHNPGGAWFARHVSGGGTPANNISRPAIGTVGFWAKTSDSNLRIALAVDDASGLTGERGLPLNMPADGQWHPYFWDVADANQWEGWVNGDGTVNTSFTLDSIQLFGPPNTQANRDATVYIDSVTHITPGFIPGDFNGDLLVDARDYVLWDIGEGTTHLPEQYNDWRAYYGYDANVAESLRDSEMAVSEKLPYAAVPEPTIIVLLIGTGHLVMLRRRQRGLAS